MRALLLVAMTLAACRSDREPPPHPPQTIKVAVIGGMMDTGFWVAIQERFEKSTGHTIQIAAQGNKPRVVAAFRQGGIDVITVHASDAMINLVADGLARDPQPWVRNDLVIVGPASDPAGIRGETDAVAAVKKIVASKSPFVVSASLGADGVLHDLQEAGDITLDPTATIRFEGERQQNVLAEAKARGAYTIVGRIPMLTGKLHEEGMEILVRGDARLRRPYLVEVSPSAPAAADELVAFLRSPETQAFIATYGKGKYDDASLFFPVVLPASPPPPVGSAAPANAGS